MKEVDEKTLFLLRLVQVHEDFRQAELHALAAAQDFELQIIEYSAESPFCIVAVPSAHHAARLVSHSILALWIAKLWASADSYDGLHGKIKECKEIESLDSIRHVPFRFDIDGFRGKRSQASKSALIESFSYMDLRGPIRPFDPSAALFIVSEYYPLRKTTEPQQAPTKIYFSQFVARSSRDAVDKYDLKRRNYISTTSMEAELALVMANVALAGPGKVVYDPFCGTGSLLVAAAHFGATVLGSDMDGRVVRGKIKESRVEPVRPQKLEARKLGKGSDAAPMERSVRGNLAQYGLQHLWLDGFVSDLTNTPIRLCHPSKPHQDVSPGLERWLDAIVCDPPYGVREGLKVLGSHRPELQKEVILADGRPAHLTDHYLPPKRPYSFDAMLSDILTFAADTLVDHGRLCIWIPAETIDDVEDGEKASKPQDVPVHPCLRLVSTSTQEFTKWSRRLVAYSRIPDDQVDAKALAEYNGSRSAPLEKGTADELNRFRRRFFEGFKDLKVSKFPSTVSPAGMPKT